MPMGLIGTMIAQLRDAVRGAVERRVVVLPHLDLLTTSQGGLTGRGPRGHSAALREPRTGLARLQGPVVPAAEGDREPVPAPHQPARHRRGRGCAHLVTQKESRKFGKQFNPWALYKYVSGVNAVRLRKLLSTLEGEDYPADPQHAYRADAPGDAGRARSKCPTVDLDKRHRRLRQGQGAAAQAKSSTCSPSRTSTARSRGGQPGSRS